MKALTLILFILFSHTTFGQNSNHYNFIKSDSNCIVFIDLEEPLIEPLKSGKDNKDGAWVSYKSKEYRNKLKSGTLTVYNKYFLLRFFAEFKDSICVHSIDYFNNGEKFTEKFNFVNESSFVRIEFKHEKPKWELYENEKLKFKRYTEWYDNGGLETETITKDSTETAFYWDSDGYYKEGFITIYDYLLYPMTLKGLSAKWIKKIKIDAKENKIGDWIYNKEIETK